MDLKLCILLQFGFFMIRNQMNDNLPNSNVSWSSSDNLLEYFYNKNVMLYQNLTIHNVYLQKLKLFLFSKDLLKM